MSYRRIRQEQQEQSSINTSISNLSRSDKRQEQRSIYQVDEGHRSKKTAEKYRTNFNLFLDYIKIHDLDVLLDLGKEAIQELVIKYTKDLRDNPEKKYSRNTVSNRVSSIHYFLDNNDIELNKRKIRRYFPSDESVKDDRPYSIQEIQRVLTVCDLRGRAMILLMMSSGVRVGALYQIQIGDLTEVNFQGTNLYRLQVYARTRDRYFTFCTPECYSAIKEYLGYRKRCGEEINRDKSPLFRKHFNKDVSFTINVPYFLSEYAIMKILDEVLKKSGVKTSDAMRSHAFRKGFKSICEQSGMKSINVEMLMGHNIGVSSHYYRPQESDILEDYMTHAADALTIDPNQRLEQENHNLKVVQAEKIEELQQEIDRNRKATEHLKVTMEAIQGALDAKSKAAYMATKSRLGMTSSSVL